MSLGNTVKSYHAKDNPIQGYICKHYERLIPAQKKLLEKTLAGPGAGMVGAPEVIQLGANLIKSIQGKRILDIGTFTGFSALGWALAIPDDGKVITFDVNVDTVDIGRPHWKEAGVDHKIEARTGPAVEELDALLVDQAGTFDFAFIDADKENYCNYYLRLKKLLRPGGIIAIDNALWSGKVADPTNNTSATLGIRALNELVGADKTMDVSLLNIADGLALAFKPHDAEF